MPQGVPAAIHLRDLDCQVVNWSAKRGEDSSELLFSPRFVMGSWSKDLESEEGRLSLARITNDGRNRRNRRRLKRLARFSFYTGILSELRTALRIVSQRRT